VCWWTEWLVQKRYRYRFFFFFFFSRNDDDGILQLTTHTSIFCLSIDHSNMTRSLLYPLVVALSAVASNAAVAVEQQQEQAKPQQNPRHLEDLYGEDSAYSNDYEWNTTYNGLNDYDNDMGASSNKGVSSTSRLDGWMIALLVILALGAIVAMMFALRRRTAEESKEKPLLEERTTDIDEEATTPAIAE
jgi:flagellar basal body-associated protein FliL